MVAIVCHIKIENFILVRAIALFWLHDGAYVIVYISIDKRKTSEAAYKRTIASHNIWACVDTFFLTSDTSANFVHTHIRTRWTALSDRVEFGAGTNIYSIRGCVFEVKFKQKHAKKGVKIIRRKKDSTKRWNDNMVYTFKIKSTNELKLMNRFIRSYCYSMKLSLRGIVTPSSHFIQPSIQYSFLIHLFFQFQVSFANRLGKKPHLYISLVWLKKTIHITEIVITEFVQKNRKKSQIWRKSITLSLTK